MQRKTYYESDNSKLRRHAHQEQLEINLNAYEKQNKLRMQCAQWLNGERYNVGFTITLKGNLRFKDEVIAKAKVRRLWNAIDRKYYTKGEVKKGKRISRVGSMEKGSVTGLHWHYAVDTGGFDEDTFMRIAETIWINDLDGECLYKNEKHEDGSRWVGYTLKDVTVFNSDAIDLDTSYINYCD